MRLLAQDVQEPGDVPLLGDFPLRLDADQATELGIAAEFDQAGLEVRVSQQGRQQDDSPQGIEGIVVATAAAPQPFEELGIRQHVEELLDRVQAGAVFQTLPGEQGFDDVDSHW
jgi:hypothetical protein